MKKSLFILILLCAACMGFAQDFYELTFTAGITRYKAMLVVYDNTSNWKMRVRYYQSACNCIRLIEQDMRVEDTANGIRIAGYRVRDAYTQKRVYDYNADNFYLYYDEYGNFKLYNYDDGGALSSVSVSQVASWNANTRLSIYNWKK